VAEHQSILEDVELYYRRKFDAHGPSAQGVDWRDEDSQELRFTQFERLFTYAEAFSVNDLGCGYGALASYLERNGFAGTYTGYELSAAMLEHARAAFDAARFRFEHGSELHPADYSVASGIFNVRLDYSDEDWLDYVHRTIQALADASRLGFAFNMLTSYSDSHLQRSDLYYADPLALFDLCKRRYSRHVSLLHDYGLWEFTIVVKVAL